MNETSEQARAPGNICKVKGNSPHQVRGSFRSHACSLHSRIPFRTDGPGCRHPVTSPALQVLPGSLGHLPT